MALWGPFSRYLISFSILLYASHKGSFKKDPIAFYGQLN